MFIAAPTPRGVLPKIIGANKICVRSSSDILSFDTRDRIARHAFVGVDPVDRFIEGSHHRI
jgi:hypothetical protein